ncbi:hypothetical protein BJ944DRAFT_273449 [Cunninghamella echinulata]|nr:hypothetical protein BJ944DRAFT_273449 [Cunninghamella echinulata]
MKFTGLFSIALFTYMIQIQAAPLGSKDVQLSSYKDNRISPFMDGGKQPRILEPMNMKRAPGESKDEYDDPEDGDEGRSSSSREKEVPNSDDYYDDLYTK